MRAFDDKREEEWLYSLQKFFKAFDGKLEVLRAAKAIL